VLFDGIVPNDIAQGNTGDCWFLAATATYAEYPNGIRGLFKEQEKSEDGSYTVKLYNYGTDDWEDVTIDDYIPVGPDGTPAFTKPNGDEMWVMLLEKAFAKFVGSYAAISGGNPGYAWIAFSGITAGHMYWPPSKSPTGDWLHLHFDADKTLQQYGEKDPMNLGFYYGPQYGDDGTIESMFGILLQVYTSNDVAACTWFGGNGLVPKHVYSFIGIWSDPDETTKLLAFRNPYAWDSDEWQGDWGDNSDMWEERSDLKEKLNPSSGPYADGIFWMDEEDFERNVESIMVWPVEGLSRAGTTAGGSAMRSLMSVFGAQKPPIGA
jgi:calpain-15